LLGAAGALLTPKRIPVHWITPPDATAYQLGRFPVNFWQVPVAGTAGNPAAYREFYALPAVKPGGRVKAAFHNRLADVDPEIAPLPVSTAEETAMRAMLERFLPPLSDRPMNSDTCMYTLTPDDHFVLGPLPQNENIFAVALAGHGFKFAPVLGEILADLLEGLVPAIDMDFFSPGRFVRRE
jgi:glycine/D-amino acid oxidase-like deaminating enzyme